MPVEYAIGEGSSGMTDTAADEDLLLLQRIGVGDRQALTEIYLRYQHLLLRYFLQLTPDHGLAEELLQDTLVAVWHNAQSFQGRSSVKTWLIGVARRQAHNTLRRRGIALAGEDHLATLPAPDATPENAALSSASSAALIAAINQLAPIYREVLALTFVHELSSSEIAAALAVPVGTVKSRLRLAKRALRQLLDASEEVL